MNVKLPRHWLVPFLLAGSLLAAPPARPDAQYFACFGCHGTNGVSHAEYMPSIAGLNFRYFYATMQAFRKDRRPSTVMGRIAKGFRSGDLQRMALHFGTRDWTGGQQSFDPQLAARGASLHEEYCEKCHEQNGWFQDKETPPLAGQAKGYLLNQMRDYRVASGMMRQPPLMQERLEKLSDEQLIALSEFYASKPERPTNTGSAE